MSALVPPSPVKEPKHNLWQRIRGSKFLFVSIVIHLLFALGATIYVVQSFTAKRKLTFSSAPPSPNPSRRALEHQVQLARKQAMSAPAQAKRIVTTGMAKFALPEMPAMAMNSESTPTKMAGMGGTGVGLGPSGGTGTGGGGGAMPFFGLRTQNGGALVGTFYDLKQTKDRKPTGMTPKLYAKEVTAFMKSGWNPNHFSHFYKAPNPLYVTQILMPEMDANKGPSAFGVEKEVQPRMWVVHYKGTVSPNESGTYHFVGFGDDIMLVKFDNKVVLVACWDNPFFGVVETNWRPQAKYKYGWPKTWPLGFVKGNAIEVRAGSAYPIEILIGEQPGGFSSFSLLIEKEGGQYKNDGMGNPILPVFRMADTKMPPLQKGESLAPHAPDGPLWKGVVNKSLGTSWMH